MTDLNRKQFELARALVASYCLDGATDRDLPTIMTTVREMCGVDAFHRILVMALYIILGSKFFARAAIGKSFAGR